MRQYVDDTEGEDSLKLKFQLANKKTDMADAVSPGFKPAALTLVVNGREVSPNSSFKIILEAIPHSHAHSCSKAASRMQSAGPTPKRPRTPASPIIHERRHKPFQITTRITKSSSLTNSTTVTISSSGATSISAKESQSRFSPRDVAKTPLRNTILMNSPKDRSTLPLDNRQDDCVGGFCRYHRVSGSSFQSNCIGSHRLSVDGRLIEVANRAQLFSSADSALLPSGVVVNGSFALSEFEICARAALAEHFAGLIGGCRVTVCLGCYILYSRMSAWVPRGPSHRSVKAGQLA